MTKDEMKDKISIALKDPILQMGFEVICNKLSRLEKENAALEEKISILLSCKNCPENKGGWICEKEYAGRCLSQKVMFIKELKQENAELEKQLTKAKELVKKFLGFVNNTIEFDPEHPQEHTDLWNELCEKAEQFINEARAMEGSK